MDVFRDIGMGQGGGNLTPLQKKIGLELTIWPESIDKIEKANFFNLVIEIGIGTKLAKFSRSVGIIPPHHTQKNLRDIPKCTVADIHLACVHM